MHKAHFRTACPAYAIVDNMMVWEIRQKWEKQMYGVTFYEKTDNYSYARFY